MIIDNGLVLLFLVPMSAVLVGIVFDWFFGLIAAAVKGDNGAADDE